MFTMQKETVNYPKKYYMGRPKKEFLEAARIVNKMKT